MDLLQQDFEVIETRPVLLAQGQGVPLEAVRLPFVHPYLMRVHRWAAAWTIDSECNIIPNAENFWPLHIAACAGPLESVRSIHLANPEATAEFTVDNMTPVLYAAAFNEDLRVMEYLANADPATLRHVFLDRQVDIMGFALYDNPNPRALARTYKLLERHGLHRHQCAREGCHKISQVALKCCGNCRRSFYCNRVCQTEAWAEHRHRCNQLRLEDTVQSGSV
jgi:hypothetical protein